MSKTLVSDELWTVVEPLLPVEPAKPKGGRPRIPDRAVLTGILFVLKNGIPWEMLPPELGCGGGMTCWRRLKAWHGSGVWARLHQVLLSRLAQAHKLDWSRASIDSSSVPAPLAKKGAKSRTKGKSGPTPQTVANRGRSAILW